MPLKEERVFVQDNASSMTIEDKNLQLSAFLATAPNRKRKIYRIDRVEVGASGWWICFRTGSPG